MSDWKRLSHVLYQCKYHIVWTPKYRYRILDGEIAKIVEIKIRAVCAWKKVEVLELNIRIDHVHMVIAMPPRISVSVFMGIVKGKSAVALFQNKSTLRKKPYWGNHFWSRGYCVTTIGMDEEKIRKYVKYQEQHERLEEAHIEEKGLF
jgi:putative transposase